MRMRHTPATAPNPGHGGRTQPSPQFAPSGEAPVVRDDQIGLIFRNMRAAMKVSRETIARRLATSTAAIDSFEAGAITALPHWKETARIIRGYCELLRIDPEPILWRMRDLMKAPPTEVKVLAPPPVARPRTAISVSRAPAAGEAEPARERPSGRRRTARALFAVSTPIAVVASVAILAQVAPASVYHAVGLLPGAIESPARAGLDYVVLLMAPRREGLRWIEVGDPRLRKADKLQTTAR